MFQDEETLDASKLEEEVAKITDEEETPSETTTEETPPEEKTSEEKPSTEEPSGTETPLKTEEEPKKEEETEDDTRFDKHPRWIQLRERAETAEKRAGVADELEEVTGGLGSEELKRLRTAGELLQKYPELSKKVQKVINEHPYDREQVDGELSDVRARQQDLEDKLALRDFDDKTNRLITEHKVDKELQPLVKEVLENRVIGQKLNTLDKIPEIFEQVLKDIGKIQKTKLASYVKDKSKETKVPASTTQKGKVIAQKSEATDVHSVVNELAEGLKAHRGEPLKE